MWLNCGLRNRQNDNSRKNANHAKFGGIESCSYVSSWRLGAIKSFDVMPPLLISRSSLRESSTHRSLSRPFSRKCRRFRRAVSDYLSSRVRNLSEHLVFSQKELWHNACGYSATIVLIENKYARNHFDRRHDFAADGCIVTWSHGRSSVDYHSRELEAQIGSLNNT